MTKKPRKRVEQAFGPARKRGANSATPPGDSPTAALGSTGSANQWLCDVLRLPDGATPFPWQEALLRQFERGETERSLDIPTGLGKTSVMAIWLVARARGAPLPRRLVYVVDRRAVVDQATDVAVELRELVERDQQLMKALGLGQRRLPISTLRGQHVDNREWLEDPSLPAIIVGTIDMIGSRLLFEGYGTTRKMRPYHAGLLGVDTLVVLDEAHLVPPFEKLIEAVADRAEEFGPRGDALRALVPPFKLLALSATGRVGAGKSFGLRDADLRHPVVKRRLDASKRLTVLPPLDRETDLEDALAERAWQIADSGNRPVRCIVFCDKREVASKAKTAIEKRAKAEGKLVDADLFVGGRRVFEREKAAKWLKDRAFIAGSKAERQRPAFVFATSAGEVGVDLDADHMVSDLVAWERMVQRLGRVNRRGDGDAKVVVVVEPPSKETEKARSKALEDRNTRDRAAISRADRKDATSRLLKRLPAKAGTADVSLQALRALKLRAQSDEGLQALIEAATSPAPLRPALSRPLVDAWSMTSLREHTGRPEIEPWLRGWIHDDAPQTVVVWRTHLPVRTHGELKEEEIEGFFEAAPPHASEMLETETYRVVKWLTARARTLISRKATPSEQVEGDDASNGVSPRRGDLVAFALTPAGDPTAAWRLEELAVDEDSHSMKKREALEERLARTTLVLDARMGGLKDGLLDPEEDDPPPTADAVGQWMSATTADAGKAEGGTTGPVIRFRVRSTEATEDFETDREWRERFRLAIEESEDGDAARWLVVEKWRHDAATEEDRSAGRPQLLDDHQMWTEDRARTLAARLGLPETYAEMLAISGRLHDEGKKARRWQRAFNAASDGVYAKTRGPLNTALLDGYRHEFGSLPYAANDPRLGQLPDDLQDLALHLIAAHHGFARPVIGTKGCEAPPSALEERAQEVAFRFARLQKRWGPWGLAWWESLLRAADQQASRDNDAADSAVRKEKA